MKLMNDLDRSKILLTIWHFDRFRWIFSKSSNSPFWNSKGLQHCNVVPSLVNLLRWWSFVWWRVSQSAIEVDIMVFYDVRGGCLSNVSRVLVKVGDIQGQCCCRLVEVVRLYEKTVRARAKLYTATSIMCGFALCHRKDWDLVSWNSSVSCWLGSRWCSCSDLNSCWVISLISESLRLRVGKICDIAISV